MREIDNDLLNVCEVGNLRKAKELINKGADVNARGRGGNTALTKSAIFGYVGMAKLLIDKGSDVNAKNDYGDTALIIAAWQGYTNVVKLLLDNNADVEIRNNKGQTAVSYVFGMEDDEKKKEILELFNNYYPEAFMSEYLDWNTGMGR